MSNDDQSKEDSVRSFFVFFTAGIVLALSCMGLGKAQAQSAEGHSTSETPGSSIVAAPYVYSDASLNGTYSVVLGGDTNGNFSLIGAFKADGKGHITAGSLLQNGFNPAPYPPAAVDECIITFSGTYSVKSNASGVMTVVFDVPASSACNSEDSQIQKYQDAGVFYLSLASKEMRFCLAPIRAIYRAPRLNSDNLGGGFRLSWFSYWGICGGLGIHPSFRMRGLGHPASSVLSGWEMLGCSEDAGCGCVA